MDARPTKWRVMLMMCFACSLLLLESSAAQGGAESLPFHGFLPLENIRSKRPVGDEGPNDVYFHLPFRKKELLHDEIVIYPHHFGFEFGKDPENKVYEIHNAKELATLNAKKHHHHGNREMDKTTQLKEENRVLPPNQKDHVQLPPLRDRPPPPSKLPFSVQTEKTKKFNPTSHFSIPKIPGRIR